MVGVITDLVNLGASTYRKRNDFASKQEARWMQVSGGRTNARRFERPSSRPPH